MDDCQRKYGDAFTLRLMNLGTFVFFRKPGPIKQVFTADSDVLRTGEAQSDLAPLVGDRSILMLDGAAHLRERRLMMPPFHGDRMHAYAIEMRDFADDAIDVWPDGSAFTLQGWMQQVTLSVILRTVFGLREGPRFSAMADAIMQTVNGAMSPLVLLASFQHDLFGFTPWARFTRLRSKSDELLFDEIRLRREEGNLDQRVDILSMLMLARREDGSPMSDQELRDELLTLVVAGHETSATALAWAFERVLLHPRVLERALAELDAVVGTDALLPEHLPKLEYIDAILKETLRLRPILPIVVRRVNAPIEIGGWELPVGIKVAPCIYLAQRDPETYPDPDAFRPERWLETKTDPYTWLPFGGGVRRCVGMAFAQYEMKIVMAETLLRTRLRLESGRAERVGRRAITLTPKSGTRVVLESKRPRRTAKGGPAAVHHDAAHREGARSVPGG